MDWLQFLGAIGGIIAGFGTVLVVILTWRVYRKRVTAEDKAEIEKNIAWKIKRESFEDTQQAKNNEFTEEIKNLNKKIEDKFASIMGFIVGQKKNPASGASPLKLNPYGVEVNKRIKADVLLEKYKDKFFERLDFPFETDYRIQEECFIVIVKNIKDILEKEEWNTVENAAYEEGVHVASFYTVFQVILRDMAIEKNKQFAKKLTKK